MPGIGFYLFGLALIVLTFLPFYLGPRMLKSKQGLTLTEGVLGFLLVGVIAFPLVMALGTKISRADAATYNEWWSTLETEAYSTSVNCARDGECRHTYQCAPYERLVDKSRQVPYTTMETYTDSSGNMSTRMVTKYRTEYYQEYETFYHQCPYVKTETSYYVEDGFGTRHEFGASHFPASAADFRWTGEGHDDPRGSRGMPALPSTVPQGAPTDWLEARDRIEAGEPGGVTKREEYKNFILASSADSYEEKRESIEAYRSKGFLPAVASKQTGRYGADKVYFVGYTAANAGEWQEELQRLNGHVGMERQGDVHLVLVDGSAVSDQTDYREALSAYWRSEELGRDTLSKNGIAVIAFLTAEGNLMGVEAFTGMPEGNEALVEDLRRIEGGAASPDALLSVGEGSVATALLSPEAGFDRIEMENYAHLYDAIQMGTLAKVLVLVTTLVLALGVWLALLAMGMRLTWLDRLLSKAKPAQS